MNIIETATDVIVLIWMMLVTAYTMMLNKKVNEIRDEILKRIGQTEGIASAAKGGSRRAERQTDKGAGRSG